MAIKYCSHCDGHPYTEDLAQTVCPTCLNPLVLDILAVPAEQKARPRLNIVNQPSAAPSPFCGTNTSGAPSPFGGTNTSGAPSPFGGTNTSGASSPFDCTTMPADTTHIPVVTTETKEKTSVPTEWEKQLYPENAAEEQSVAAAESTPIRTGEGALQDMYGKGVVELEGIVHNYEVHEADWFILQRIWQVLWYKQRYENRLHSFLLTQSPQGGTDDSVSVNIHGTMNGGVTIRDKLHVKVRGKFRHDNIFMAEKIWTVNGRTTAPVTFQHDVKLIFKVCLVLGGLGLLLLLLTGLANMSYFGTSSGALTSALSTFFGTWILVTVLLYMLCQNDRVRKAGLSRLLCGRKYGILRLLVISLVLTLGILLIPGVKEVILEILFTGFLIYLVIKGIGIILRKRF